MKMEIKTYPNQVRRKTSKQSVGLVLVGVSMMVLVSIWVWTTYFGYYNETWKNRLESPWYYFPIGRQITVTSADYDELPARQKTEFSFYVPHARDLEVGIVASEYVETQLIDPTGEIKGQIDAYTEEARMPSVRIVVENPKTGRWLLRMLNHGEHTAVTMKGIKYFEIYSRN